LYLLCLFGGFESLLTLLGTILFSQCSRSKLQNLIAERLYEIPKGKKNEVNSVLTRSLDIVTLQRRLKMHGMALTSLLTHQECKIIGGLSKKKVAFRT